MIAMPCTVLIENSNRRITVEQNEILLTALLSRGVRFAYSCQSGNCGACKCQLVAGQVEALPFSDGALSPVERERGIILACRSLVRSDLTIHLSTPAETDAA